MGGGSTAPLLTDLRSTAGARCREQVDRQVARPLEAQE